MKRNVTLYPRNWLTKCMTFICPQNEFSVPKQRMNASCWCPIFVLTTYEKHKSCKSSVLYSWFVQWPDHWMCIIPFFRINDKSVDHCQPANGGKNTQNKCPNQQYHALKPLNDRAPGLCFQFYRLSIFYLWPNENISMSKYGRGQKRKRVRGDEAKRVKQFIQTEWRFLFIYYFCRFRCFPSWLHTNRSTTYTRVIE